MIFDDLLFKPMPELKLVEAVSQRLQEKYFSYQKVFFFLGIKRNQNDCSEIQSIKVFPSDDALNDFFFASKFQMAMIYVGFKGGCYSVELAAYEHYGEWDVTVDKVEEKRLYKASYNPDTMPMMSRAELDFYMTMLKGAVNSLVKRKAS